MVETKKRIRVYDFCDICVACGGPAAPGELLCASCLRLTEQPHCARRTPKRKKDVRRFSLLFHSEKNGT